MSCGHIDIAEQLKPLRLLKHKILSLNAGWVFGSFLIHINLPTFLKKCCEMNTKIEKYKVENSSTILMVSYDNLLNTLDVEFRSGSVYQYVGVPRSVYVELMEAESVGKFFHANIKKKFDFLKKVSTPRPRLR